MKTTGTLLAGTAAAVIAIMGATGAAEAKSKKHVHISIGGGHFHGHPFHRRHLYLASPYLYEGCGYEKRMWWKTGSYYWKQQYYLCKGWW